MHWNLVDIQSHCQAGLLVWARLTGYPWWPAILCNHPTLVSFLSKVNLCLIKFTQDKVERRVQGQREYHVQFLGEQSRSWITADCVKRWEKEVNKSEGERDENWRKGVQEAEKVKTLSNQERLDLLLVPLLPSDDDWSDEEVSPIHELTDLVECKLDYLLELGTILVLLKYL